MKSRLMCVIAVVCLVSAPFAVAGGSDIGFKGVGPVVGFVSPNGGIGSTIGFGAVADLGWITPQIGLEADALYWSKSYDVGADYKWTYSQFYIAAIAKYYFAMNKGSKIEPYAGGGLGLVMGKVKSEYSGPTYGYDELYNVNTSVSHTNLTIMLVGGAKMPLSPKMDGFAEVRYSTASDLADIWGIFVGVIFKLN
jgi:opacity protein-like surface antigen